MSDSIVAHLRESHQTQREPSLSQIGLAGAVIYRPVFRKPLTREQRWEISKKIDSLVPSWVCPQPEQWIYNHLRVAFQAESIESIPADCFDAVMALLDAKKESISQYLWLLSDLRKQFECEVLGGSTPWTPHIRRKLFAKLKGKFILPPQVDWLALAEEVGKDVCHD
ncbi:hypothetical protein NB640_06330 [Oxalobacter vibrioformis]|uniref:Uncharacterized protein n=1 Tax=Oxalobacter vibrioformis TaxID=933080 RepID=A0A9E9M144_9BURK|nr:hypothetical protein [Oxalobacter vibrioformis]WAW11242.1 hypothetical protein NB640_06330 [Oxalobacter vibrioformis]